MLKKCLYAAAIGGLVFLTGCGGGGGGSSSSNSSEPGGGGGGGGSSDVVVERVEGPLDPAQEKVSTGVFGPLGDALAGTPLEGVVRCADATVTWGTLDVADRVLVALQSGAAAPTPDPQQLAASLQSIAVSLQGLLEALAGDAGACLADSLAVDAFGDNPLAGTPLAPLGEQLAPVLAQIAALGGGSDGSSGVQLDTLASLFDQLYFAVQGATAQIPAEAYDAPVVGGALTTLATSLDDTRKLVHAVIAYNSSATATSLQNLLDHALVGLLTDIVPLHMIEDQAGQSGVISGPVETAAAQLAAQVAGIAGTVTDPVFAQLLSGALDPVLAPIENELMPALLGAIGDALAGGGGLGDLTGVFAGTPLAPVVNLVVGVLDALLGTAGGGGGGGSGGETCPFAGLPLLSVLCEVV